MRSCRGIALIFTLAVLVSMPAGAATKGSFTVSIDNPTIVAGKQLETGNCKVVWVVDNGAVDLKFFVDTHPVVEAKGKMAERAVKAASDSFAIKKDAQGNQVVTEIRLGGKKNVIVLE